MPVEYRYRGRTLGEAEIAFLREFIAAHPELSRCALSRLLCQVWQWKQPNGAPREMVCRGLMLELERAGYIQLPPIRFKVRNNSFGSPAVIFAFALFCFRVTCLNA